MKEATSSVDLGDDDEETLADRDVKECWMLYLDQVKSHTTLTTAELCSMMQLLVDARAALCKIDDGYYRLACDSLTSKYNDLLLIAKGRNITDYPVMPFYL